MSFGPQISAPSISGGASMCKQKPKASLLPPGLTAAQIKIEMRKWQNAFEFSTAGGGLDIAYDGVFARSQRRYFCALMVSYCVQAPALLILSHRSRFQRVQSLTCTVAFLL
jgi:hypothetical protein